LVAASALPAPLAPLPRPPTALVATQAATLPLNRVWLSFFSPDLVYVPSSNTLCSTGLNASSTGDCGFAVVKSAIAALAASGIDVLLSMGGWDGSCWPLPYTVYSVGGYGTSTPNYFKIQQYCNGQISNASPANEFCYTCEPPSANETMNNFAMFVGAWAARGTMGARRADPPTPPPVPLQSPSGPTRGRRRCST
jgi:hypothetical protein